MSARSTTPSRGIKLPFSQRVVRGAIATLTVPLAGAVLSTAPASAAVASASDPFSRIVSAGWGSAGQGGSWAITAGYSRASVNGAAGVFSNVSPGMGVGASLGGVSGLDVDVAASFVKPAAFNVDYAVEARRQADGSRYLAQATVRSNGTPVLAIARIKQGVVTLLKTVPLGVKVGASQRLRVQLQVSGSGAAQVKARTWVVGSPTPSWQANSTDTSPIAVAGSVGISAYATTTATTSNVVVDDFASQSLAPVATVPTTPSTTTTTTPTTTTPVAQPAALSLRDQKVKAGLKIGTAVNGGWTSTALADAGYVNVLNAQFSSVTPENQMKWGVIHPSATAYNFGPADDVVNRAISNGQVVRGHTLVWHGANPAWLTGTAYSCSEMKGILKSHIDTVVGRYKGKIQQWDVANEIFDYSGVLRQENPFIKACGVSIVADAFRWAHSADPAAILFFNDYNVEGVNTKSTAYYNLTKELLAQGVPVQGFGMQTHMTFTQDLSGLESNMRRFDALGLQTAITEMDVAITTTTTATADQLAGQASTYQAALKACINVAGCTSFTVWGFTDKYSWLPQTWTDKNYGLIYTADYAVKPAYGALLNTLNGK